MWAASLTGLGMASVPVWSGAPALYLGAPMSCLLYTSIKFMEVNTMNIFKKTNNKETKKLPMTGKVKKGFRA